MRGALIAPFIIIPMFLYSCKPDSENGNFSRDSVYLLAWVLTLVDAMILGIFALFNMWGAV